MQSESAHGRKEARWRATRVDTSQQILDGVTITRFASAELRLFSTAALDVFQVGQT
jgi:hypothetical protein